MEGLQYTGFRQGEIIRDQHGREYVFARKICASMYVYDPRQMLVCVYTKGTNAFPRDEALEFETTGRFIV